MGVYLFPSLLVYVFAGRVVGPGEGEASELAEARALFIALRPPQKVDLSFSLSHVV